MRAFAGSLREDACFDGVYVSAQGNCTEGRKNPFNPCSCCSVSKYVFVFAIFEFGISGVLSLKWRISDLL